MSIFSSAKTKWCNAMRTHVVCQAHVQQLEGLISPKKVTEFLAILYSHFPVPPVAGVVDLFVEMERDNVIKRRNFVATLLHKAATNQLARDLNANILPVGNYYTHPTVGAAPTARELAIDQAANWVCGAYAPGIPGVKAQLEKYIPPIAGQWGKMGPGLGTTVSHIKKVHAAVVPGAPAYRFNYAAGPVTYPSTVGAGVLMDEIFTFTARYGWPPFGSALWENMAMFYLTSLVTVQGFSDGNKRAGHMAYAIVLIKGTHAFKAPTATLESTLFRMNG